MAADNQIHVTTLNTMVSVQRTQNSRLEKHVARDPHNLLHATFDVRHKLRRTSFVKITRSTSSFLEAKS